MFGRAIAPAVALPRIASTPAPSGDIAGNVKDIG